MMYQNGIKKNYKKYNKIMITTINEFKKINESSNQFNVGDMIYVNPFGPSTLNYDYGTSDRPFNPRLYNVDLDTQYEIIHIDGSKYGIFDNDNNYIELSEDSIAFTPFENVESSLPYLKNESFSDNDEQLYHEINWNDLENKFNEFSSTYSKEDYVVMRQTYNFIKEEIEKYKILM